MKSFSKALAEPQQPMEGYLDSDLLLDKATKNKIQRHLTDINDHITEEDIRNIDTNITASSLTSSQIPSAVR